MILGMEPPSRPTGLPVPATPTAQTKQTGSSSTTLDAHLILITKNAKLLIDAKVGAATLRTNISTKNRTQLIAALVNIFPKPDRQSMRIGADILMQLATQQDIIVAIFTHPDRQVDARLALLRTLGAFLYEFQNLLPTLMETHAKDLESARGYTPRTALDRRKHMSEDATTSTFSAFKQKVVLPVLCEPPDASIFEPLVESPCVLGSVLVEQTLNQEISILLTTGEVSSGTLGYLFGKHVPSIWAAASSMARTLCDGGGAGSDDQLSSAVVYFPGLVDDRDDCLHIVACAVRLSSLRVGCILSYCAHPPPVEKGSSNSEPSESLRLGLAAVEDLTSSTELGVNLPACVALDETLLSPELLKLFGRVRGKVGLLFGASDAPSVAAAASPAGRPMTPVDLTITTPRPYEGPSLQGRSPATLT